MRTNRQKFKIWTTMYIYGLNIKLQLIGQPKWTVMEWKVYSYCLTVCFGIVCSDEPSPKKRKTVPRTFLHFFQLHQLFLIPSFFSQLNSSSIFNYLPCENRKQLNWEKKGKFSMSFDFTYDGRKASIASYETVSTKLLTLIAFVTKSQFVSTLWTVFKYCWLSFYISKSRVGFY